MIAQPGRHPGHGAERLGQHLRVVGQQGQRHRCRAEPGREGEQRQRLRVVGRRAVQHRGPDRRPGDPVPRVSGGSRPVAGQQGEEGLGRQAGVGEERGRRSDRQGEVAERGGDPVRGPGGQVGTSRAQHRHRLGAGERPHLHGAGEVVPSTVGRGDQDVAGPVRQVTGQLAGAARVVEDQQPAVPPPQCLDERRGRPVGRVRRAGQTEGLREFGHPVGDEVRVQRGDPPGHVVAVAVAVGELGHHRRDPQPGAVGVRAQPHRPAVAQRRLQLRDDALAVDRHRRGEAGRPRSGRPPTVWHGPTAEPPRRCGIGGIGGGRPGAAAQPAPPRRPRRPRPGRADRNRNQPRPAAARRRPRRRATRRPSRCAPRPSPGAGRVRAPSPGSACPARTPRGRTPR